MFGKYLVLILSLLFCSVGVSFARQDSSALQIQAAPQDGSVKRYQDSVSLARWEIRRDSLKHIRDSVKTVSDSLLMAWIKRPDPNRPNRFLDSIVNYYMVKNMDFKAWAARFSKLSKYDEGIPRARGELWTVGVVMVLLLFFAILKNAFFKELSAMMHAFFSNRVLGQINKEENFFNSWPFVFLYLLFGFTLGMLLYQCSRYFQLSYGYSGFNLFLRLSFIVIGLYTLKILILGVLGFLFNAGKMVKEYTSILFMSYFNAALFFLPVVIAFTLTPARFAPYYIYASFALIAFIFFFQFMRAVTNILSSYRFPKFYLIIYLCALEISPILVLIKALRF